MKSQKSKFIAMMAAALFMVAGTNIQAQQDDHPQHSQRGKQEMHQRGPQGKPGERGPKGPRIPNLTEEQKEQMKAIHVNSEKEALPLKNQVAEKEARLRTLTTAESYNASAINQVIDEISGLKGDLMKLKVSTGQEIKKILTDEQVVFFNKQIGQKKGPERGRRR